jgi:hypothetical protein
MDAHQQPDRHSRREILLSVMPHLWNAGFNYNKLRLDIPTTALTGYQFESYLYDSGNLALLKIPPSYSTEANLFKGPQELVKNDLSFSVHTLAGSGELIITRPGSYTVERVELYRGAAVHNVRAGDIYAYRAGPAGLVVGDYCEIAFQPEWDEGLESGTISYNGLVVPKHFWINLQAKPNSQKELKKGEC